MNSSQLAGPRGRLTTTWKFMKDPYRCYREWKQKYGDTFLVKAMNGEVVATCNTENARTIFALPTKELRQFATGTISPLVGPSSLFLLEGEEHRKQRAKISPCFYGQSILTKADEIRNVATNVSRPWQYGDTVRMMDFALDVSLEVIIRVVFGVENKRRVEGFRSAILNFVSAFHPVLAFSKLLHRPLFGLSPWPKFVAARDKLTRLLDNQIQFVKQSGSGDGSMLSILLDAAANQNTSSTNVRDQLVTMLLAGHETTQIAIAWAMSWLHRHPQWADNIRDELGKSPSSEEILNCKVLDNICNESLRLNPIVSDIVRTIVPPLELEDCQLIAGTNVAVAICLIHEDPILYPCPNEFLPERWESVSPKPYQFLPFGGGIRRCIGAPLAIMEMKLVIATWIEQFRLRLPENAPPNEPIHRRNITMAPKSGIPLVVC